MTLIFDEDLKKLQFPKIKSLVFRVNRLMPLELAAKLLASKNGQKELWRHYQFGFIKKEDVYNKGQR